MQNTKGLALEVRLSAYIDGEVSEVERRELEHLVHYDDEARLLLEMLKAGNNFGNSAFEEFLHDPVPLSLVRHIKQGSGAMPRNERAPVAPQRKNRVKIWPRALVASLALFLVGGSTGFIIGKASNDTALPTTAVAARTWLDDIADYHRIYARQAKHLVEVPASQEETIKSWLSQSVGIPFRLPDLEAQGLTFQGARLLVAAGKPVAQLMYKSSDGDVVAICFLKSKPGSTDSPATESIRDDLAMISWQKSGASYVVVGSSAKANLQELADRVSAQII
ncbi:anti-sigma factor RsiW [Pararhizobium capsulatum DSM 1112]|uniref:Anti-sigma factor RsiW n=1 Tax=Pararhizobium capsulatum DSM 1112 TaxID=1121113 RepID=A0ABU0BSN5_9HYPH|nr:anti-sigma factor [Pararhizobium capsulatum]MDQ0321253.1 anti-sigma factor RsiW [Pararhizobium capsulatum DSM 1112]